MGGYIGLSFADYYVNHVQGLLLLHSTTYEDNEAKKNKSDESGRVYSRMGRL